MQIKCNTKNDCEEIKKDKRTSKITLGKDIRGDIILKKNTLKIFEYKILKILNLLS